MNAEWIFDGAPASGARHGGLAQAQIFTNSVDSFVREVLQNARDQRRMDSSIVTARFRLDELQGPALYAFLEAAGWSDLEPHLQAVADAGYVTISPRIAEGLDEIRGKGRLRVLRIDDSGTNGLVGDENDVDSNFNSLCRHTLITPSYRRESGGSFGLGKSVLWRFSTLSTVLFASYPSDEPTSFRFFGRTQLAWHDTDHGEWEGSGWFGSPEIRPNGRRAISIRNAEAEGVAAGSGISREHADTGTTILVVGFDDPGRDVEKPLPELCSDIVDSAARWFWPAITNGDLEVRVEGYDTTGQVFSGVVTPTNEVMPFVAATSEEPQVSRTADPGDVAERSVQLRIPGRRLDDGTISPALTAEGNVRLRLAQTGEVGFVNRVALRRGAGMIVEYWEPPRLRPDLQFHAVLTIGTGRGDATTDHAAEEFLRAAEPVAHTEWSASTDRIRAEYTPGSQSALTAFFDAIGAAVRDMLSEPPVDTTEGPEALRRLFPLPATGGGSVAPEPYRLSGANAYLTNDGWVFGGAFSRSRAESPWRIRVALQFDPETGGGSDTLDITTLSADAGKVTGPDAKGSWEILAKPGVSRVRFDGRTAGEGDLPAGGLSLARVRLDVRTIVGPEE